jgi:hypothetical protein
MMTLYIIRCWLIEYRLWRSIRKMDKEYQQWFTVWCSLINHACQDEHAIDFTKEKMQKCSTAVFDLSSKLINHYQNS